MNNGDIKIDERVCYNCKHMLWMVGIGLGVRCGYTIDNKTKPPMIPNLRYTCENFNSKFEKLKEYEKQS